MIDKNCNFIDRTEEDVCRIIFDEEIKQVIVSNQTIVVTDVSTKDRHIKGLWTIVDWHEGVETSSTIYLKN